MVCDLLLSCTELFKNGLMFVIVGVKHKVKLGGELVLQN